MWIFIKWPIGFGMAMAMKEPAMAESRKQSILNKSHNAGRKMHEIANSIVK